MQSPAMIRAAPAAFQGGRDSPRRRLDVLIPNIGTRRAVGVTVAAG
jgi:hypothetical protein